MQGHARACAEAGVDRLVVVGTGAKSSAEALELTDLSGEVQIYATVGLHPHDAKDDLAPSSNSLDQVTSGSWE